MKIKLFSNIAPKDPSVDEDAVTTSCSNRYRIVAPCNMEVSQLFPLDKCFIQSSMIINLENLTHGHKSPSASLMLSKMLSSVYNQNHVLNMRPVSEEEKNDIKLRLLTSDRFDKFSEKSRSFNIFGKALQADALIKPHSRTHKPQGLIAKIYQSSKTGKFHLFKYNAVKGESSNMGLEGFFSNRTPQKEIAIGKRSGYYFIYDNQGSISVICEHIKICELLLPDCRVNPTLFVYEVEQDRIILLVAGGFAICSTAASGASNSIAVFYLNIREPSHIMTNEPIMYIKMKYHRMHPIILAHKNEKDNQKRLIIIGGNIKNEFKPDKKSQDKKKFQIGMLNEANMMCETIRLTSIWESISRAHGENVPILSTEDCLYLIVNGKEEETNEKQTNNLRCYLGNAGVLQIKDRKKHQISFIFGVGNKNQEVWYIDLFDFVEHKAYIYQSQCFLRKNTSRRMCNAMVTKVGDDVYYLDDDETCSYRKIPFRRLKASVVFSNCSIF